MSELRMAERDAMTPLLEAAKATEEAMLTIVVAAKTMAEFRGLAVYALPHERLMEVMRRYCPAKSRGATG